MKKGSYVPDDIVANILPRLPAKSLVRFKYLSRSWFSFISQLKFGNKKLVFSTLDYIKSVDLEAPNSDIKALPLESPDSKGYGIELIGSCNGLLCILQLEGGVFRRGKISDRVVVWNPLLSTHKTIQLPSPRPRNVGLNYRDQYGFGYDKSSDDYKILRIILCPFHSSCCDPPLLNIYSLKTDCWETKTFPWPFWFTRTTEAGTFMDGALYWHIFYLKLSSCDVFKMAIGVSLVILSYDFIDENVSAIELPDNIGGGEIHIHEFGERLCMFHYKYTKRIDIWAMEKKENNYNWIKWMCIPPLEEVIYSMCLTPLYFMKDCQVLVNIVKGERRCFTEEFRIYSPKENFRKIKIEGIESSIFHREFLYQETLISPILLNLKNKSHLSQKQKAKTRSHSPLRQKAVTVSTRHCDRKPRIGVTTLRHNQNSLDQEVVATVPSSRQRKREGHETVCCCFPWSL